MALIDTQPNLKNLEMLAKTPAASLKLSSEISTNSTTIKSLRFGDKNEDNCLDVGYYVHKKSLGEGGFGKVRLGTHLKTNQKVAIKMMNKEKLGQDLQRVRIEIEALKVLQHDSIAKLLQVIETSTDIYLVLEYCSGGELFDYLISKKRLNETEVRSIMKDLFNVLMFIHNRGFAHRDLKPENILFDENHRIKLIDFGLAANSSQNKSALAFLSTCCGSPAYAAPELLRGLTYSGPAVDVWSAGVLLYSLLVGQLPFDDENINNLYKKIQIGHFVMPQWLSSDVRDLIGSMLKINPVERITVSKVLNHKWLQRGEVNSSKPILSPQESDFDENAFSCCQMLFHDISAELLRSKIKHFGYHTATYLLLRKNVEAQKYVQLSCRRNTLQQQLNSNTPGQGNLNSPRIAAIKRKLALEGDIGINNSSTPVKRTREIPDLNATPHPQQQQQKEQNKIVTPLKTRPLIHKPQTQTPDNTIKYPIRVELPKVPINYRNSPQTPKRITDKVARRIVSPRKKNNENDYEQINYATNSNTATPVKLANIKSPLREINNCLPNSSSTPMRTPVSVAKKTLKTPSSCASQKKSLLKRIMASATPARSHSPRKLTNSTPSNNITMTSFQDPQQCIDRLVHTLRGKGVECKQKDFSLKCYFNDKIHSTLKFDLEICRFNGLCVIHRKRLKGDAWNYKKICELILQLSNEEQLAALASDGKKSASTSKQTTSNNNTTTVSSI